MVVSAETPFSFCTRVEKTEVTEVWYLTWSLNEKWIWSKFHRCCWKCDRSFWQGTGKAGSRQAQGKGSSCWGSGDKCALVGDVGTTFSCHLWEAELALHPQVTAQKPAGTSENQERSWKERRIWWRVLQWQSSAACYEGMNAVWWGIPSNSQHHSRGMRNWSCEEQEPTLSIVRGSNVPWDNYLSSFQVNGMHCCASWEVR